MEHEIEAALLRTQPRNDAALNRSDAHIAKGRETEQGRATGAREIRQRPKGGATRCRICVAHGEEDSGQTAQVEQRVMQLARILPALGAHVRQVARRREGTACRVAKVSKRVALCGRGLAQTQIGGRRAETHNRRPGCRGSPRHPQPLGASPSGVDLAVRHAGRARRRLRLGLLMLLRPEIRPRDCNLVVALLCLACAPRAVIGRPACTQVGTTNAKAEVARGGRMID